MMRWSDRTFIPLCFHPSFVRLVNINAPRSRAAKCPAGSAANMTLVAVVLVSSHAHTLHQQYAVDSD